MAMIILHII